MYIMAQSLGNINHEHDFRIRIQTEAWPRNTAVVKETYIDFYDATGAISTTIKTDRHGNSDLLTTGMVQPLIAGSYGPNPDFDFVKINNRMTTWMVGNGVEVIQQSWDVWIRVPATYMNNLEGLCGNFNMNPEDDYQKPDGTILPPIPGPGFTRTNSEWETAKSWIVGDGDGGPDPITVTCEDADIAAECDALFDADWIQVCDDLVGEEIRTRIIKNCKIDYCASHTVETKKGIVGQYVAECKKRSPKLILCDWVEQLLGNVPQCGDNQEWLGCADECDLRTCEDQLDQLSCTAALDPISTCVCSAGFFLQNGNCVPEKECNVVDEWTLWSHWSTCSVSCAGGTKRRVRACRGEDCDGDSFETAVCDTQDCPPDPNDMRNCKCPKGSFTCAHKNCGTGDQCEAIDLDGNFRCRPLTDGVCRSWGDPHITTFDNALIDVYGIATYLMAESVLRPGWFRVFMKTRACGSVSCIDTMYFVFPTQSLQNAIVMAIDRFANVEMITVPGNVPWMAGFNYPPVMAAPISPPVPSSVASFTLSTITTHHVKVVTWFGVELTVEHQHVAQLKVPALYQNHCRGLCGDFNFVLNDDYKTRGGHVLEYTPAAGYIRTDNEWTVAKSWIWDGGDGGPNPAGLKCPEKLAADVKKQCHGILLHPDFDQCREVVEFGPFEHTCNVDFCQVNTQETLDNVIKTVMAECAKHAVPGDEDLCQSDLVPEQKCQNGLEFRACAKVCSDVNTCEDFFNGKQCPEVEDVTPMCVCPEGTFYDGTTKSCTAQCGKKILIFYIQTI